MTFSPPPFRQGSRIICPFLTLLFASSPGSGPNTRKPSGRGGHSLFCPGVSSAYHHRPWLVRRGEPPETIDPCFVSPPVLRHGGHPRAFWKQRI
ncbi:hypothetical protein F5X68DRAFT_198818 [Plectosphaerella plurivora]|uniref:Secreted protein n=1 Tax=Plectosphaerella plurivora TaxID=936078 RepID=A0A9P8VLC4_9PEZI|nr:hypothetical protein F5X68DRAFT_198818 [Plectosphaerella plurivora]